MSAYRILPGRRVVVAAVATALALALLTFADGGGTGTGVLAEGFGWLPPLYEPTKV